MQCAPVLHVLAKITADLGSGRARAAGLPALLLQELPGDARGGRALLPLPLPLLLPARLADRRLAPRQLLLLLHRLPRPRRVNRGPHPRALLPPHALAAGAGRLLLSRSLITNRKCAKKFCFCFLF